MTIIKADIAHLPMIRQFVDYWLSGRGTKVNAPGAVNDYFVSPSQHKKYIEKYDTYLLLINKQLIGWAVIQHNNTMIHFLIAGTHRGKGIGSFMLKYINPKSVHSKSDQSSGNPGPFYEKHGYKKVTTTQSNSRFDIDKIKPNRKKNIEVYEYA